MSSSEAIRMRVTATLTLVLVVSLRAHAHQSAPVRPDVGWRGYTTLDGLRESYCSNISVGPSGRVYVVHGYTDRISVLDGYSCRQLARPGIELKVREGHSGEVWAFAPDAATPRSVGLTEQSRFLGLQRYVEKSGSWEVFDVPEIRSALIGSSAAFLPAARGRVIYLLPDRILEFDAETRASRVVLEAREVPLGRLTALEPGPSGSLWIGGDRGVLLVDLANPPGAAFHPLPAGGQWRSVRELRAGLLDGVTAAIRGGRSAASETLARLRQGRWEILAESTQGLLAGWESPEGGYWVAEGAPEHFSVVRHDGFRMSEQERTRLLSGLLRDVAVAPDGAFWFATNIGAVRHAQSAWVTPPLLSGDDKAVVSMAEDSSGRLYFVTYDRLLRLEGGRVTEIPFPADIRADLYRPYGTGFLADGTLAVPVTDSGMALFDPSSRQFSFPRGAGGGITSGLSQRREGGLWVSSYEKDSVAFKLQYLDERGLHDFLDRRPAWKMTHLRVVYESQDGAVWIGGVGDAGLARYRDGEYKVFDAAGGYTGGASYAILDAGGGVTWFGDRDGIHAFDGAKWTPVQRGLETVRSMMRSKDGSIWVASGAGLHRYHEGSWVTLTARDGLPDGGMNFVYEDSRGRIWACGTRGVSLWRPDADRDAPETTVPGALNLRSMPPEGTVRLSFSGIDRWHFTEPGRLLYSYRLDGGNWSPFRPEETAAFSGVRSGGHLFEVRAMDRNWNIDPTPAIFRFEVLRHWYLEPAFLILAAAGCTTIAFLIGLHIFRHVRLAQLVGERTAELTATNEKLKGEIEERERATREKEALEEQVRQSQKMEAIGRLSGGVAHDFNNLLTVINGYSDLILNGIQEEDSLLHCVREIQKAGGRAAALTQQLLAFSRKQVMSPSVVNLNPVVRDVEDLLRRMIGENIELVTVLEPDLWKVKADPVQLQQVLMNLAVNARDAMPAGGRLTIGTANTVVQAGSLGPVAGTAPGEYVRLRVSDNGSGMDSETKSRVFDPFFTTKGQGKGTGLGLSTVFGVVKQSGGHIHVDSAPGEGAVFTILLPRLVGEETSPLPPTQPTGAEGGRETVLLVEDQRDVRRLAQSVLTRYGYRVVEASTGEEALRIYRQCERKVDLVISDVVMPGVGGVELAASLRELCPGLKILLVSGYADHPALGQVRDHRGTAFLQKPFTPVALAEKVRELLDMRMD
jgi:signal transduction histidine kinase/CheY-like chemotaxis protein/streptogramin lyase